MGCQTEKNKPDPISTIDSTSNNEQSSQHNHVLDTSRIAIIPLDNVEWLNDNYSPTNLSIAELSQLDTLLSLACEDYNLNLKKGHEELMEFYREDAEFMGEEFTERAFSEEGLIRELSNYRRQYVPYYNELGEKTVHVFCHCLAYPLNDWKLEVAGVNDGGNCHFDAVINLTKRTCKSIMVNGNA
ncbi:MAG: hypothetical protein ACI8ZM_000305 [Crocinitomix sp.]|jgi:hypothetical protein